MVYAMPIPDHQGSSIVNLMTSLSAAMGGAVNDYPELGILTSEQLADNQNIVLFVIDGLGYEYLTEYGTGSTLYQHLAGKMTSVFPSTTATAITTFMTGLAPKQHGLTGWFTYLKELGCITAVLPFRPRVGANTFNTDNIDIHKLYGHTPLFDLIDRVSYVVAPEWIIHSDYNVAHSGSALLHGYNHMQECFANIESLTRCPTDKKYIYAYWPDFDRYSHEMGCHSDRVSSHFEELDLAFKDLLKNLNGTNTTVIVTADHGFIDTAPGKIIHVDDHPEIQQSLVMPLCGEPRAAYCYIHPDREAQFVEYINNELSDCMDIYVSKELVERGYFGSGQAHPRLTERTGHYTLIMKQNYIIKDQLAGEAPFAHIGVHGGTSAQEMYVPLIVAHC